MKEVDSPQEFERFFNKRGERIEITGMYSGRAAFLLCNGPSFLAEDKTKLDRLGIITMGLNNGPATYRPNLWMCNDEPYRFLPSIWLDPRIMKIVPKSLLSRPALFRKTADGRPVAAMVANMPNVICFNRGTGMEKFIESPWFAFGEPHKKDGVRSVMLPAIKALYWLGFSRIYLLGCDFNMSKEAGYHFDQGRSDKAIENNNRAYQKMSEWMPKIRQETESRGVKIYNCNKDSNLKAFEYRSFSEAIEAESADAQQFLGSEIVSGRYEALARENANGKSIPEICCALNGFA